MSVVALPQLFIGLLLTDPRIQALQPFQVKVTGPDSGRTRKS